MASGVERQFDRVLQNLFLARTQNLRCRLWPNRGAVSRFTKRTILNAIRELQVLAEDALLKSNHSKGILRAYDHKRQWHPKRNKGHGRPAKRENFRRWYERSIKTQNCVYVFWARSNCLYVGRTLNGKGRPSSHFEKHWFGKATRIDIYGFDRKRDVPRFECMFTHWRKPGLAEKRPASKKYFSPCPICEVREHINTELKTIFRLR